MAGLLQVQLEGSDAAWLGYCRFSLRVMLSGWVIAGSA